MRTLVRKRSRVSGGVSSEAAQAGLSPGGVIYPTMLNSWVDFGGSNRCFYRKVGPLVTVTVACKTGATATPAFNIPVGYRPAQDLLCLSANTGAASVSFITVKTNGDVQPATLTGSPTSGTFATMSFMV